MNAAQNLFDFEQAIVDAEQAELATQAAAKAAAKADREAAREKQKIEKSARRRERQRKAEAGRADMFALCGIRFYSCSPRDRDVGNYWKTCHGCGQPLQYHSSYEQAETHQRECKRI